MASEIWLITFAIKPETRKVKMKTTYSYNPTLNIKYQYGRQLYLQITIIHPIYKWV